MYGNRVCSVVDRIFSNDKSTYLTWVAAAIVIPEKYVASQPTRFWIGVGSSLVSFTRGESFV